MVCWRIDCQNGVISMQLISGKLRMMQRPTAYQCSSTFAKRSMFPPDDLLRDELGENEISKIHEIEMLWREAETGWLHFLWYCLQEGDTLEKQERSVLT